MSLSNEAIGELLGWSKNWDGNPDNRAEVNLQLDSAKLQRLDNNIIINLYKNGNNNTEQCRCCVSICSAPDCLSVALCMLIHN